MLGGKLDQAFNLHDRERRESQMDFLDAISEFEAMGDCIRKDTGTSDDGPSRHLPRDLLDQLTG